MPQELTTNRGRGLFMIGTLQSKHEKQVNNKRMVEAHLICGETPAETVYLEGWGVQANKLADKKEGDVLKVCDPQVKNLGERSKYQCSCNQTFASIAQYTTVETLKADQIPSGLPKHMPLVPLEAMSTFKQKAHQVCTVGIVTEIVPATKANGPELRLCIYCLIKFLWLNV